MESKRVCYVILTCDKNKDRREAIENTWGKNSKNNTIWLTEELTAIKGYESCPYKYIEFFKSALILDYDWFVFVDDDTYVHVTKLESTLQSTSNNPVVKGLMIGEGYTGDRNNALYAEPTYSALEQGKQLTNPCKLVYVTGPKAPPGGYFLDCYGIYGYSYPQQFSFPHGGAGIVMNKAAVKTVSSYLRSLPTEDIPMAFHSDVTLAVWLNKTHITNIIDDESFNNGFRGVDVEVESLKAGKTFTCHYVLPTDMYKLHSALEKTDSKVDVEVSEVDLPLNTIGKIVWLITTTLSGVKNFFKNLFLDHV